MKKDILLISTTQSVKDIINYTSKILENKNLITLKDHQNIYYDDIQEKLLPTMHSYLIIPKRGEDLNFEEISVKIAKSLIIHTLIFNSIIKGKIYFNPDTVVNEKSSLFYRFLNNNIILKKDIESNLKYFSKNTKLQLSPEYSVIMDNLKLLNKNVGIYEHFFRQSNQKASLLPEAALPRNNIFISDIGQFLRNNQIENNTLSQEEMLGYMEYVDTLPLPPDLLEDNMIDFLNTIDIDMPGFFDL